MIQELASERKCAAKAQQNIKILAKKRPNSVQHTQNDGVGDFDNELKANEEFFQQYLTKDRSALLGQGDDENASEIDYGQ